MLIEVNQARLHKFIAIVSFYFHGSAGVLPGRYCMGNIATQKASVFWARGVVRGSPPVLPWQRWGSFRSIHGIPGNVGALAHLGSMGALGPIGYMGPLGFTGTLGPK